MTKRFVWTRDDDGDWECDRGDYSLHVDLVPGGWCNANGDRDGWNASYRRDALGFEDGLLDMLHTSDEAKRACETWSREYERNETL